VLDAKHRNTVLTTLTVGICQANENLQSVLEKSNLKKALYCMDILENRSVLEPSGREYVKFIEHWNLGQAVLDKPKNKKTMF